MLATIDPRRPKQANLRRAVSTAYYALFHLLTIDAAKLYARDDAALIARMARSFSHADLKNVSREFSKNQLPKALRAPDKPTQLSATLMKVTDAFVILQTARHAADYDLSETFTRPDTLTLVKPAETAFAHWTSVKSADDARLYLACFSNWDSWNKPPR